MRRRHFLSGLLAATALPGVAQAQAFVTSVIAQLRKQGFKSIVEERTLLGRVRITATRSDGVREIIINPRNGEILRDLWTPTNRTATKTQIIEDKSGSSGRDDENGTDDDESDDGEGDSGDDGEGDSGDDDSDNDNETGGGDESDGDDSGSDSEDDNSGSDSDDDDSDDDSDDDDD